MRLFFYGTLMDFDVLTEVLGCAPDHVAFAEAVLPDHTLRRAQRYSFPVLIPERQSQVSGLCADGFTAGDVERIRYFEDVEYELKPFLVGVRGVTVEAHAFSPSQHIEVSGEPWDFLRWQRQDKPLLLSITRELFSKHFGLTPIERIDPVWHEIRARHERRRKPAVRRAPRTIA